jgi:hypothetical protein
MHHDDHILGDERATDLPLRKHDLFHLNVDWLCKLNVIILSLRASSIVIVFDSRKSLVTGII